MESNEGRREYIVPLSDDEAFYGFKDVAEPLIRCKDCIYYDPPHVENNGKRYEYKDMPEEAFDSLGTGLVSVTYGNNIGGRCCRDYHRGYPVDKRVFVDQENYCGRAEKKMNECYTCGFWDSERSGCTCPSSDMWYACPVESEKPENKKALDEYAEWARAERKEE